MQKIQYASFDRRLFASTIDIMLLVIILTPFLLLLDNFIDKPDAELLMQAFYGSSDESIISFIQYLITEKVLHKYLAVQLALFFIISILFITIIAKTGTTPGKYITNCQVVDAKSHSALTVRQSAMRFYGYILSIFPLGLGLLMMHFNEQHQTLHDYLAGTIVIRK